MAESCGTPTPATTREVQILAGPRPTLIASAPASAKAMVPSRVATLPTITGTESPNRSFSPSNAAITLRECPWAVSITNTSTSASTIACALSHKSSPGPNAAATRRRPFSSLVAKGYISGFSISLIVIRPCRWKFWSTKGSFSILCW